MSPLWEVSSTLLSPQITQGGESCLLFLLGACFSWHSLLCPSDTHYCTGKVGWGCLQSWANPALQTEGAQLESPAGQSWDKQLRFGAVSSSVHQGPDSIHQSKPSPDSSAAGTKNVTGHGTGCPVPQEWLSSCQPENGNRKMEKTLLGPQEFLLWEQP